VLEVEAGGRELGRGLGRLGAARLGLLDRDGVDGKELVGALGLVGRDLGARGREVELGLVPARVDAEEQVARLHDLAGLEVHGIEVPGDPGAQLHGLEGVDVAR
jgi:hypothetical protein